MYLPYDFLGYTPYPIRELQVLEELEPPVSPAVDELESSTEDPSQVKKSKKKWCAEEDDALIKLVQESGQKNWNSIAQSIPGRDGRRCRERWQNQLKINLAKEPAYAGEEEIISQQYKVAPRNWKFIAIKVNEYRKSLELDLVRTPEWCKNTFNNRGNYYWKPWEDTQLIQLVQEHEENWEAISKEMDKTPLQCHARWVKLDPKKRPSIAFSTSSKKQKPNALESECTSKAYKASDSSITTQHSHSSTSDNSSNPYFPKNEDPDLPVIQFNLKDVTTNREDDEFGNLPLDPSQDSDQWYERL